MRFVISKSSGSNCRDLNLSEDVVYLLDQRTVSNVEELRSKKDAQDWYSSDTFNHGCNETGIYRFRKDYNHCILNVSSLDELVSFAYYVQLEGPLILKVDSCYFSEPSLNTIIAEIEIYDD